MIKYNPQFKSDGTQNGALTSAPSDSIIFDVPGKCIWVKGVKLTTSHTYTFSHDNYITLTNTPGEPEDILIGVNTTALKNVIDTTYGIVNASTNGLAPMFSTANKATASAATTYNFLGIAGSTLKWYQLPWRNVRINAETTDKLGVNDTSPLIISQGTGISVTWDATNKKIVISNTAPDQNHNTDRTGVKLGTVSGTKKTDETVILANSIAGLTLQGSTNKFLIGDGTNYIEVPITINHGLSTKNITINGTAYALYTSANSLPTFVAPGAYGTANYILATNSSGNGLTWVAKPTSNVTTTAIVGNSATATSQITAAQTNPYYNLLEGGAVTRSIRFVAGTGITISAATDGLITITNASPDVNHNTDRTGVKLGTVSGTLKTDSTLIIANSGTGLVFQGGTNLFKIGDGTNYIQVPITPSFTVTDKSANILTSLTTLATIAGTDIKAKVTVVDNSPTLTTSLQTIATIAGVEIKAKITNYNTDQNVKQTPKTDNVNRPLMMINGGTTAGELTSTSMFSIGIYANASSKMITANGFIKNGYDDTSVLLAGGGAKALTDFAMADLYVKKAGDTMQVSSGTMLHALYATDVFGYNPSYGTYIGGNFGSSGSWYIYSGNATYSGGPCCYVNGTIRKIAHTGNITSSDATLTTSLLTIATIAGVDIKAKITNYNTDENVKQTDNNNNLNSPILLKNGTGTSQITSGTIFADGVTVNPSNNSLSVSGDINLGGTLYYGKSGWKAIMAYNSTYTKYGIWYNDSNTDQMTFSASGNANTAAGADFCINGAGDGTLTARGNLIWHAGNDGHTSGLDADTLDGNHASAFALAGHTHRYINSSGFSDNGGTTLSTWGTLTSANSYTGMLNINESGGGSWEIAAKSGQISMLIDGYYYQNEGRYRTTDVTETVTALGTSGNYLTWTKNGSTNNITVPFATNSTYATYATHWNASNLNGSSSWAWNPFSVTLYWCWGEQFYNSSVSSDTGDLRFYLAPISSAGGAGICMNIDGHIATLSCVYAGLNMYAAHFYENSDARLKHDIIPISKSVKQFKFHNDERIYYGFIALELEILHPELVDSSQEYKKVNYDSAICYYIAELENKVQKLEDEINKLKNK